MAFRYYHNFATMQSFQVYHKTVVAVNALSARVTEGVPINNTHSLSTQPFPLPPQHTGASLLHLRLSHCPLCCALLLWVFVFDAMPTCLISFGSRGPVRRVTCHGSPASPRLLLAERQPVGPNETGAKNTLLRSKS